MDTRQIHIDDSTEIGAPLEIVRSEGTARGCPWHGRGRFDESDISSDISVGTASALAGVVAKGVVKVMRRWLLLAAGLL